MGEGGGEGGSRPVRMYDNRNTSADECRHDGGSF